MCQGKKALATETVAEGGGGKGREWHSAACLLQSHLKHPSYQRGVLCSPLPYIPNLVALKPIYAHRGESLQHRPSGWEADDEGRRFSER
jgi:hypothetical protein